MKLVSKSTITASLLMLTMIGIAGCGSSAGTSEKPTPTPGISPTPTGTPTPQPTGKPTPTPTPTPENNMTAVQARDAMALNALFYPILTPVMDCLNDLEACVSNMTATTSNSTLLLTNNPMSEGDHNCTEDNASSGQYRVSRDADTFSIKFGTDQTGECTDVANGQDLSRNVVRPCILKMMDLSGSATSSGLGTSSSGYVVDYSGSITCTKGEGADLDNYVVYAHGQTSHNPNRNSYNATLDITQGIVIDGTYHNEKWAPGNEPAEDKKINDELWTLKNLGLYFKKDGSTSTIAANGSADYFGKVREGDIAHNGMRLSIGFDKLSYIMSGTTDLSVSVKGGVQASCHPELVTYGTPVLLEDINATRDSNGSRMPDDGTMSIAIPDHKAAIAHFDATATPTAQVFISAGTSLINYHSWREITTKSSCAGLQDIIDRFLKNIKK